MANGVVEQDLTRVISTGAIYLFLFDKYWHIADPATLEGVFGSNPDISNVASLPSGAQFGPTIAGGSAIWKALGADPIYFVCTGNTPITAYWITSPEALAYYQFNGTVQTCDNQVLNDWLSALIARGPNIDMPS